MSATLPLPEKPVHLRLLPFVPKPGPPPLPLEVQLGVQAFHALNGDTLNGMSVVPDKVAAITPVEAVFKDEQSLEITGYQYSIFMVGMYAEPILATFRSQADAVSSRLGLMRRVSNPSGYTPNRPQQGH